MQPLAPIQMRCEVAVAEVEPGFAVEPAQRVERVEALALETPSVGAIDDAGERVNHRVDIGRNVEPVEMLVIAGIDDDAQPARIDPLDQSAEKLSRPHSPRKRGYRGLEGRGRSAARHWEPFCRRVFCTRYCVRPRPARPRRNSTVFSWIKRRGTNSVKPCVRF